MKQLLQIIGTLGISGIALGYLALVVSMLRSIFWPLG
jgi:hypothetical protein